MLEALYQRLETKEPVRAPFSAQGTYLLEVGKLFGHIALWRILQQFRGLFDGIGCC